MYKPGKGNSTRIEYRAIDSACNPYLAFAVILAAGLKGIEDGLRAARRCRGRRVVAHRRRAAGDGHQAVCRPAWTPAISLMEDSELVAETLGEGVFEFFLRNKRQEWSDYRHQVTPFELDRYLTRL